MAVPAPTAISPYLSQFGISGVDNAMPTATPAILAFLRGMGMSWDQLGEQRTNQLNTVAAQSQQARQALDTQAQAQQRNLTADTVLRGQMASGLAGQRSADLANAIGKQYGTIDANDAQQRAGIELGYAQGQDQLRQNALERLLNERQGQDVQKATLAEQQRQNQQMTDLYNQQHADAQAQLAQQQRDSAAAIAAQQAQWDAFMKAQQPTAAQQAQNQAIQNQYNQTMANWNARQATAAPAQPGYYGTVPGSVMFPGLNSIYN